MISKRIYKTKSIQSPLASSDSNSSSNNSESLPFPPQNHGQKELPQLPRPHYYQQVHRKFHDVFLNSSEMCFMLDEMTKLCNE